MVEVHDSGIMLSRVRVYGKTLFSRQQDCKYSPLAASVSMASVCMMVFIGCPTVPIGACSASLAQHCHCCCYVVLCHHFLSCPRRLVVQDDAWCVEDLPAVFCTSIYNLILIQHGKNRG